MGEAIDGDGWMDNDGSITGVGGEELGCVDGSKCAGLGVTVVCGRVLLVVSLLVSLLLSLLLSLFVSWG